MWDTSRRTLELIPVNVALLAFIRIPWARIVARPVLQTGQLWAWVLSPLLNAFAQLASLNKIELALLVLRAFPALRAALWTCSEQPKVWCRRSSWKDTTAFQKILSLSTDVDLDIVQVVYLEIAPVGGKVSPVVRAPKRPLPL